jgi:hypothetical protein
MEGHVLSKSCQVRLLDLRVQLYLDSESKGSNFHIIFREASSTNSVFWPANSMFYGSKFTSFIPMVEKQPGRKT